jgi:hypothetical protein
MKTEHSTVAKMVFNWFINQFFLVLKIDTVLIREFPADGRYGTQEEKWRPLSA